MKKSNLLIWIFTVALSFVAFHISAVFYIASNIEREDATVINYRHTSNNNVHFVSMNPIEKPQSLN